MMMSPMPFGFERALRKGISRNGAKHAKNARKKTQARADQNRVVQNHYSLNWASSLRPLRLCVRTCLSAAGVNPTEEVPAAPTELKMSPMPFGCGCYPDLVDPEGWVREVKGHQCLSAAGVIPTCWLHRHPAK